MRKGKISENAMHVVFLLCACASIIAVVLICLFIFVNGVPAIMEISPLKFLGGTAWKPKQNIFGVLPMIVGSLYVTAGGVLFGVPVGILCAIFMARFCPERIYKVLKPAIELLSGIPSIVYGFFGLVVLVPMVRKAF